MDAFPVFMLPYVFVSQLTFLLKFYCEKFHALTMKVYIEAMEYNDFIVGIIWCVKDILGRSH